MPSPTVLATSRSTRIATFVGLPVGCAAVGAAVLAFRDDWLAQDWLPWRSPVELLDRLAGWLGGWGPLVFVGLGLVAGLVLALAALDEEVSVAVTDEQVSITRGSSTRHYLAEDVREALLDAKHLVLVADNGTDLVRIKTAFPGACAGWGFPGARLRLVGRRVMATDTGTLAVDHVSLAVPRGSLTGLGGPNGAGKTTSLAMAVGLLRPDAGTASVHGVDVWAEPTRAKTLLGVLPDGLALPERLTGGELLTYWGLLRGMGADVVRSRAAELMRILELDDTEERGVLVIEYSTGMRKKIGLATALLHGPKVLVLDEPFEAVDPVSARVLRAILRRFVAAGGSVVISSHVMALVEDVCDRVAIITDGRVRADGTLAEVRGESTLEEAFVRLVGERRIGDGELAWLGN